MKIKTICAFLIATFILTAGGSLKTEAQEEFHAIDPSAWSATDDLGRRLSSYGDLQKEDTGERFVGMFFWNWHEEFAKSTMPVNLTDLMGQAPEAKNDYHHPIWQGQSGYFFWNEPIYGYYSSDDQYVIRKQAELLADAGVDVIIFDCTNGEFLWQTAYRAVLETFAQAREEGVHTPQIAFMLNFAPAVTTKNMLRSLYKDLYRKEQYKDLWFYWKGKPLILAYPDALDEHSSFDHRYGLLHHLRS